MTNNENKIDAVVIDRDEIGKAEQPAKTKAELKRNRVDAALQNFDGREIAEPQKKKKHGWISTVVLVVVIALGLWFIFSGIMSEDTEGGSKTLGELLANANWTYAAIAIAIVVAALALETIKYSIITNAVTKSSKFRTSLKVALLGKYYDNITPFASGGQPMQIYYLHKKGYSAGTSTAIIFIKYFANTISWILLCLVLMVTGKGALDTYVTDATQKSIFLIAGWIGWGVNALLPVLIVLLALFPKITGAILKFFINIGAKLKLVRNKEKLIQSAYNAVADFRSGFVLMAHRPLHFAALVLVCVVEPFLSMSLPYFVFATFASAEMSTGIATMLAIMSLEVYAQMSVTVVPTPGNSGAMEVAIKMAFGSVLAAALAWSVVTWRFMTYYIYLIIGIGITLFEVIRKAVRAKREKQQ